MPIVLLALTVHEFCHAYFALRMGDPTAQRLGRCTLNPLKHLTFLGTVCLMFAPIGWAKPVPINPENFHDRRKGILVSTAAGPASNVVQAFIFALLLRLLPYLTAWVDPSEGSSGESALIVLYFMFFLGVLINVALAVFNCLPLFPLDGFHITYQLLKPEQQAAFAKSARFGPLFILALVMLPFIADIPPILLMLIAPPTRLLLMHVGGLPASTVDQLLPV